jgi:hypothetical protein
MPLNDLLSLHTDIPALVACHLDAAALVRLGMVSESLWRLICENPAIMRDVVLRTLPGASIYTTNGAEHYRTILSRFFAPNEFPPHETSFMLRSSIEVYFSVEPQDEIVTRSVLYLGECFRCFQGRAHVINAVDLWTGTIATGGLRFFIRRDAVEILDAIAGMARSCFFIRGFVVTCLPWAPQFTRPISPVLPVVVEGVVVLV